MVGCSSSHLLSNTDSYALATDNMEGFVKLLSSFCSGFFFSYKNPRVNSEFLLFARFVVPTTGLMNSLELTVASTGKWLPTFRRKLVPS